MVVCWLRSDVPQVTLGPPSLFPGGMVGGAGAHRDIHGISNGCSNSGAECLPVPGRQLLESLGTHGQEENAAHSRASSQHPQIIQRRKEPALGSRQRCCNWSESEGAGRGSGRDGRGDGRLALAWGPQTPSWVAT